MTATLEAATTPSRPARPERGPGSKSDGWIRRAPLLPALIFTFIVTQLPFVVTIFYSLQSWNLVRPGSQHFVWFENYARVFTDNQFRTVALNTVVLTVGSVLIAVALGLLLALLLNRAFFGRGFVRTLLITPFLITPVAAALLWKTVLLDPTYGLVNFVLSPFGASHVDWISKFPLMAVMMALVWQWTPFMMLLILAGLQSQPADVLEAAGVDGASNFAIFREITVPHLRRFIELGIVLGTIYLINQFDAIYMMTSGGPGIASSNLPFYIYQRAFLGFDIGQSAAMGVVVALLTTIVSTFALRLIFRTFSGNEESA
ncbi:carbohydrate ABC transporter permease [Pseudonocardia spinosispora]|uniref:carbohydrate ABC transporter permease n=1 Tax=Pseudonocardia spinosispora TaxID=103441 RepID=UPI0004073E10|nr:sugar ABC transporter permease [Pseudonocardia spinosispora]